MENIRQIKGISYEIYVRDNIRDQYDNVWLWRDTPESILHQANIIRDYNIFSRYRYDIGADVVAVKHGEIYFIQCKNFEDCIQMEKLAGFYFLLYEYDVKGILYYNGHLSNRVKELSTGRVEFINLKYDNSEINKLNLVKKVNCLIPREYQIEAYNKLKDQKRSILSLPCGMGKTFTSFILSKNYSNIVILAPLRVLTRQLLDNFNCYYEHKYNTILISADGTRDIDLIEFRLKSNNIIGSTYKSVDILRPILDKLQNTLIIIDEYHNLSDANINDQRDNIYQILDSKNHILFLSATPRFLDNPMFGNITYNYKWTDAIKNKYINDFDIIIPSFKMKLDKYDDIVNILDDKVKEKILIKKCYFLVQGLLYYGNRKSIIYLTDTKKANQCMLILDVLSKLLNTKINTYKIDYKTSKNTRVKILEKYNNDDEICIICNVHILDEGIDILSCDSVLITNPNYNVINIVQRINRCTRYYKDKVKSKIFLWCTNRKINKILDYLDMNTENIIKSKIYQLDSTKNKIKDIKYEEINEQIERIIPKSNLNDIHTFYLTTIPELIHKYFNIPGIDMKYLYTHYNEFTLDLEKISTWLNIRKDASKRLLVTKFKKGIDYKISKNDKPGSKKYTREIIMITANCFKLFCVLARTKKAQKLKMYYIELEKLLFEHRQYFINRLS